MNSNPAASYEVSGLSSNYKRSKLRGIEPEEIKIIPLLMKKIYLGCSLTHSSEEYKQNINKLKDILRQKYEILDFIGLGEATNQEVYEWNEKMCKTCDLFLMESTYPSTGLGIEFGIAMQENKPIIAIAQREAKVTRMLLGVTYPKFEFHKYDEIEEIVELIDSKLNS